MSKLEIKEGQTYVCKRDDIQWWTLGKEYKVVFDKCHGLVIVDDDGSKWRLPNDGLLNNVFKLKEDENKMKNEKVKLDELNKEALEKTYTPVQVRDAITKAYLEFDNDTQRLAFLQGYFSK